MSLKPFRKRILDRYKKNDNGDLLIEISVNRIEDLFHNFDRNAPFIKKELDQDLVEYIIDSAEEIGKSPFRIQFQLLSFTAKEKMDRVRASVRNYFEYLIALEQRDLMRKRNRSISHLFMGIAILLIFLSITPGDPSEMGIIRHIISEGLIVAVWVALWSGIDTFLISWRPHKNKINLYKRIIDAPIHFLEVE